MLKLMKVIPVLALVALPVQADLPVKFFGTATANDLSPEIVAAMEATGVEVDLKTFACFELPIYKLNTGRVIGIGVDCLNIFDDTGDVNGAGAQLEAKTFFFMPRGTLVNHGCTSVRPFFEGVGNSGVTHMTGSIGPDELGGTNPPLAGSPCETAGGIVHTTRGMRRFRNGEVRLSGAVDLSEAGKGVFTFSCLFVMNN